MPNALLAICIPTYNKAEYLRSNLERLIPQASQHNIAIYISDNASTDQTPAIVAEYQRRYTHIYYSRNEIDFGPERNFEIVLRLPKSQYSWLLGDDDLIVDGAIATVLRALQASDFDLLIVNAGRKSGNEVEGRVRDVKSRLYTDRNELLSDLGWHMTWISAMIYSSKLINGVAFNKYYFSNFLQFSVVFDYISDKKFTVCWLDVSLVHNNYFAIPGWYSVGLITFGQRWIGAVNALPAEYSQTARAACIKGHGVKSGAMSLGVFFRRRILGYYTLAEFNTYRNLLPQLTDVSPGALLAVALIPIPHFMSVIFRKLYIALYRAIMRAA